MNKGYVRLMKETCVFYPDALFAGRYGLDVLQNKAWLPFVCDDENAVFKSSMAYAIAKTIELASVFKRVYLEHL